MSENHNMKFTVLAENHEACGLECEHGLSIFIEYKEKKYLLDAGQSGVFARNAEKLGIDLEAVDVAFLSHAHYDHGDGFEEFFRLNGHAKVYAREEGKEQDCYSVKRAQTVSGEAYKIDKKSDNEKKNEAEQSDVVLTPTDMDAHDTARYIGIAPEILREYAERFCWTNGQMEVTPGIWLVPHTTPELEKIGEKTGMYREICRNLVDKEDVQNTVLLKTPENKCFSWNRYKEQLQGTVCEEEFQWLAPEGFQHEHSLVFETAHGLAIFNSCSHGGVANIVNEVRQALPDKNIYAYIGGFHLKAPGVQDAMNCTEQEVEALGRTLLELGIERIYTGHCTGERGFQVLKGVMGEKLELLRTGLQVEF